MLALTISTTSASRSRTIDHSTTIPVVCNNGVFVINAQSRNRYCVWNLPMVQTACLADLTHPRRRQQFRILPHHHQLGQRLPEYRRQLHGRMVLSSFLIRTLHQRVHLERRSFLDHLADLENHLHHNNNISSRNMDSSSDSEFVWFFATGFAQFNSCDIGRTATPVEQRSDDDDGACVFVAVNKAEEC